MRQLHVVNGSDERTCETCGKMRRCKAFKSLGLVGLVLMYRDCEDWKPRVDTMRKRHCMICGTELEWRTKTDTRVNWECPKCHAHFIEYPATIRMVRQ